MGRKFLSRGKCKECGKRFIPYASTAFKGRLCPDCLKRYRKKHRESNPEQYREERRRRYKKYHDLIFQHYGQRCNCCGETTPEFLTIDHVHGKGCEERKAKGSWLLHLIVREGYPDRFQILCWNCNAAKAFHKGCPHQRGRD